MKKFLLASIVASVALSAPLFAQAAGADDKEASEEKQVTSGLGFVVSSGMGSRLKGSKLYYRDGKGFKSIIVSGRMVSQRIRARGGKVEIWDEEPVTDPDSGKVDPPRFTVTLPSGVGSRPVCFVQPYKDKDGKERVRTTVLSDSMIPSSGQHIINLSPYPLTLTLASKSDFSDRKDYKIAAYRGSLTPENAYSVRGANGSQLSFILSATTERGKEPMRLRASRFAISNKQGQVTLIFKDPARVGAKMESIVVPAPAKSRR